MLFLTLQAVSGVHMWFQKHSLTQGDGGKFSPGYTGIFGCHPGFSKKLPERTPSFHVCAVIVQAVSGVPMWFQNHSLTEGDGGNVRFVLNFTGWQLLVGVQVVLLPVLANVKPLLVNVNEVFKVEGLVPMSRTAGDPSQRPFQPRLFMVISQQWLEIPRRST